MLMTLVDALVFHVWIKNKKERFVPEHLVPWPTLY